MDIVYLLLTGLLAGTLKRISGNRRRNSYYSRTRLCAGIFSKTSAGNFFDDAAAANMGGGAVNVLNSAIYITYKAAGRSTVLPPHS